MLIINADDLGRSTAATDAALACHARGRITSTSAMVFMADSERAAREASRVGIAVGLHLNFSEEFSAPVVPEMLRKAHDQVRKFLTAHKYARLIYNPLLKRQFQQVFAAQLTEFLRLYGRPPSHLDGHQHLHLTTNALLQHIFPAGSKVRRHFSFRRGEKGWANRWYRSTSDRFLRRRNRTTDYFFSISDYLTSDELGEVISLAQKSNVELMVHPERDAECAFLMSDAYFAAVSRARLGTYEELR